MNDHRGSGFWVNGYVYETFGISKLFPIKLQVLLIRAKTLDNPLTAKCFIYDVGVSLFIPSLISRIVLDIVPIDLTFQKCYVLIPRLSN